MNSLKFGETDLIVKTYTKDQGPITFMLKGIRKSKKGKFKISMFQPMSLLDIEFNLRENKNFQYLTEAKSNFTLHNIQSSIHKSSIVIFVAEVLSSALKEEMKDASLFEFIEHFIITLENTSSYANFPIFFCLELTRFLGFYPEESETDSIYFNLQEGCFETKLIHANCRSGNEVEKLKELINLSDFDAVSMNRATRRALLSLVQHYYEIHLPGYQYPKSIAVIQELMD